MAEGSSAQEETKEEEISPVVDAEAAGGDGTVEVDQNGKVEFDDANPVETDSSTAKEEEGDNGKKVHMKVAADAPWSERMWEVFSTFWPLGLVAFGGPQVRRKNLANPSSDMLLASFSTHRSRCCTLFVIYATRLM